MTIRCERFSTLCPPGGAYQFSAGNLHSTVPNKLKVTGYSIDFRMVNLDEALGKTGAVKVDSACTGTTMGDYLRTTDLAHLPEEAISLYLDRGDAKSEDIAAAVSRR